MTTSHSAQGASVLTTVKYSLPELLAEIQLEKQAGTFVSEKLPQADIARVFQAQPKRRRGKPGQ